MKKILLLLTMVLVILSSCSKSESNLIITNHDKPNVVTNDTTKNVGSQGNPDPANTNGETGSTNGHPSYIARTYKVKRLDSLSIYIVTSRESLGTKTYFFKVGDTVNINIYSNEIRSKDQFTRVAIITNRL